MKKIFIVLVVLFLCGCQNPYHTKLNEHKAKMREWQHRFEVHKYATNDLDRQEASFIKTLNDKELSCYESAVQAFRTSAQTSQEIARRNLQASMNEDKYQRAMQLLNARVQICNETTALGARIRTLKSESEYLERWNTRQREAVRDYMLRESIRNRNTQW